jgi:hypothetical protein
MVESVVSTIPRLLAVSALLVFALIVAFVVARVLRAILNRIRFDALVSRSGIDRWMERLGVESPPADVIPRIVFWVLIFLFAREAATTLGLSEISEAIGQVMAYLPRIIAAFLILLVGGAVARMAGRAVESAGRDSGLEQARTLGRTVTGAGLFILVVMALTQLELDTELVRQVALVLLAGATLAVALSFGLGTRDVTRNIMAGYYARRVFKVGDEVELDGRLGTIEAITPTQTILRTDGRAVVVSNGVFLDSAIEV